MVVSCSKLRRSQRKLYVKHLVIRNPLVWESSLPCCGSYGKAGLLFDSCHEGGGYLVSFTSLVMSSDVLSEKLRALSSIVWVVFLRSCKR